MRLRTVLFNPLSLRGVGRRYQIVCRASTHCGTPSDTAEYLRLASDVRQRQVVLSGLGETPGSDGCSRLVRGDVDLVVVVAYMWPEACCRLWLYLDCIISSLPDRSIPLLLLDANGHTGLQMVQPKVWLPVSSDAIGPRFPKRENINGGSTQMSDLAVVPLTSALHHCVHVQVLTTFVCLKQVPFRFRM